MSKLLPVPQWSHKKNIKPLISDMCADEGGTVEANGGQMAQVVKVFARRLRKQPLRVLFAIIGYALALQKKDLLN